MENILKLKELSVFFPCYNEEKNIKPLMQEVLRVLPEVSEKFEIILVNDGSKDNTSKLAHEYEAQYPFVRVIDQKNSGYGGAVMTGLKACKYEWVFFSDADLQFRLDELHKFIPEALKGTDLVIGYRLKRAEGIGRALTAKGIKLWSFMFFGFPLFIKDVDCAFKLIKKEVIDNAGDLYSTSNLISSELLLKAYRLGYSFKQIGVNHYNRVAGMSTCGGVRAIAHVMKDTVLLLNVIRGNKKINFGLRAGLFSNLVIASVAKQSK